MSSQILYLKLQNITYILLLRPDYFGLTCLNKIPFGRCRNTYR